MKADVGLLLKYRRLILVVSQLIQDIFSKKLKKKSLRRDLSGSKICTPTVSLFLAHIAFSNNSCHFLASTKTSTLIHTLYTPNSVLSDVYLFPRINKVLKGKRFADVSDVKHHVTAPLQKVLGTNRSSASNNGITVYPCIIVY